MAIKGLNVLVYMTALYRFPYQYEGGFLKAEKSAGIINNFFTDISPNLAKGFNPQEWVPVTPPVDTTIGESEVGWESVRKLCRKSRLQSLLDMPTFPQKS